MASVEPIALLGLLNSLRERVQNIKVYRRKCWNLVQQCEQLISALSEDDTGSPLTTAHADALSEAQTIILSVRDKVLQWANLNTVQSFRNQGDIREAVAELHQRVGVCIASFQVRMNRQLVQGRVDDADAIRNDLDEIRGTVRELLEEFTVYKGGGAPAAASGVFGTVVEEIAKETQNIPPAALHGVAFEIESQSSISQLESPAFDDAMSLFCRSLISLELAQPIDEIAQTESRNVRTFYRQPSAVSSSSTAKSLMSLVVRRRSSSVPHIPPQDFSDEDTFFTNSLPVEPSRVPVPQVTPPHSPRSPLDTINISTPLEIALTTHLDVRQYSVTRVIIKATMAGLISYLLERSPGKHEDLHDIFFIAHLAFISPLYVLEMLIRQYDKAPMHNRKRVLCLMRDWLNNDHVIFTDEFLTRMMEFVANVNRFSDLDQLLILEVMHGIRKKAPMNLPLPVSTPPLQPTTGCRPTAHHLAVVLAKLEWGNHQRIMPMEYVAHAAGQRLYSPNLSAAISRYELVKRWVQSSVLQLDEGIGSGSGKDALETRSKMMQFLVDTAKECQNIHNFSSLGAIMSALTSESITRLTLTRDRMSRATRRKYGQLAELITSDSNFNLYRRASAVRGERVGCIPWHVVELHDIKAIMQQDVVDEQHEPPLLILEKWADLKRRAMYASRYYELPKCHEHDLRMAEAYLTEQLRRVESREDFEIALWNASNTRKKEESAIAGPLSTPGQDLLRKFSE